MTQGKQPTLQAEERFSTLLNNAGAVRTIASTVESTLGPKGLDVMLVGSNGEVLITNDGVTILEKMDVSHPAARLLIQVASSQQQKIGDGTTTATVLAGAIVNEGVSCITKGVPVSKVIQGIELGIREAIQYFEQQTTQVEGLDDPRLFEVAYVAGREQEDLTKVVMQAAHHVGPALLCDDSFVLSDCIAPHLESEHEVWPGIVINRKPQLENKDYVLSDANILVLLDGLQPENLSEEALTTEAGFQHSLKLTEQFHDTLQKILDLQVNCIILDRNIHSIAEQFCADHGIMVLPRVKRSELLRVCDSTGAKPLKRNALTQASHNLQSSLGKASEMKYDPASACIKMKGSESTHNRFVSVLIGAHTNEVVSERVRIAKDIASALQAAMVKGYLPGAGAAELAASREVDRLAEQVKGMEAYGVSVVATALRKPLAQIVANAGFNALEKVEEVRAEQLAQSSLNISIDCNTGLRMNCLDAGILDPTLVKIYALQTASEIAQAILRIHTIVKMNNTSDYSKEVNDFDATYGR